MCEQKDEEISEAKEELKKHEQVMVELKESVHEQEDNIKVSLLNAY